MYYIAYGINMNKKHFSKLCANSKFVSFGYLKGYRLEFQTFANIVQDKNGKIPVVVWEISKEDLKHLDLYESNGELYKRIELPLYLVESEQTLKGSAYAYTMLKNPDRPVLPAPQTYIDAIAEAYQIYKFDLLQLYSALYVDNE